MYRKVRGEGEEDVHDHPPAGVPGGDLPRVPGDVQETVRAGAAGDLPGGGAGGWTVGQVQDQHQAGVSTETQATVWHNCKLTTRGHSYIMGSDFNPSQYG